MIFHVNYEELQALRSGADAVLGEAGDEGVAVAAPPEERALVEALVALLDGDVTLDTLQEQREMTLAITTILHALHAEMDTAIVETHPAHEGAVAAYFDYAHCRAVLGRLEEMGAYMEALIEVVTGDSADEEIARSFNFPD